MIYVECTADEALVKVLLPRRQVVHEIKGKPAVVFQVVQVKGRKNCVGMVDEDPGGVQPAYLVGLFKGTHHYRVLEFDDKNAGNRLVVLRPRLEEWVISAAKAAGVDVERYSLPNNPSELHEVIGNRLDNFQKMLRALISKNSRYLAALSNSLKQQRPR